MKQYSIAIDGPAGSGKSTVAKEIAKKLGILYVDTGAMYRTVGLYCIKNGIDLQQQSHIVSALKKIDMKIELSDGMQMIFLNGENVTQKIRTQEAGKAASAVAAILPVREKLVEIQRNLAKGHSVIMDGRDIGTNVLPDAAVKIYLNASVEQRTKRRCYELAMMGKTWDKKQIEQQIIQRDESDMNRKYHPLKKAEDAIEIDTSFMSIEEVVFKILNIVEEKIKKI
ncbi:MAG TPA: (d)CMP kinase [Candidatus Coprocola pullicola]|nr:(d)CMP kinase [Candidatus Coprocola pullicola]